MKLVDMKIYEFLKLLETTEIRSLWNWLLKKNSEKLAVYLFLLACSFPLKMCSEPHFKNFFSFFKEKLKQIFTLHKICENTGIYWLIFSRIRTKSTISKNPYSRIFYAVLFLVFSCLFKRVFLLVLNESPYNVNLLDY